MHCLALVAEKGAEIERLYVAGLQCTAMLYSFQTLYIQVDNMILRRGRHALRHDANRGLVWGFVHMVYHLALVLLATGLGIALRDVAFPLDATTEEKILRAAGSTVKPGVEQFSGNIVWVFTAGWGGSMICSAILSLTHMGGPRAATKWLRLTTRCVIALGLSIGMPFSGMEARSLLGIFSAVSSVMAVTEFVLVQLDRMGLFRSEESRGSSMELSGENGIEDDGHSSESCDEGEEEEEDSKEIEQALPNMDMETAGAAGQSGQSGQSGQGEQSGQSGLMGMGPVLDEEATDMGQVGGGVDVPESVARALQRRLTRGNTTRLVAVQAGTTAVRRRRQGLG